MNIPEPPVLPKRYTYLTTVFPRTVDALRKSLRDYGGFDVETYETPEGTKLLIKEPSSGVAYQNRLHTYREALRMHGKAIDALEVDYVRAIYNARSQLRKRFDELKDLTQ